MDEKVINSIITCQTAINELKELKTILEDSLEDTPRFIVQTKHWYGYSECGYLGKNKSRLNISKYTMNLIIDEAIKKEKERINALIDKEINKETNKKSK